MYTGSVTQADPNYCLSSPKQCCLASSLGALAVASVALIIFGVLTAHLPGIYFIVAGGVGLSVTIVVSIVFLVRKHQIEKSNPPLKIVPIEEPPVKDIPKATPIFDLSYEEFYPLLKAAFPEGIFLKSDKNMMNALEQSINELKKVSKTYKFFEVTLLADRLQDSYAPQAKISEQLNENYAFIVCCTGMRPSRSRSVENQISKNGAFKPHVVFLELSDSGTDRYGKRIFSAADKKLLINTVNQILSEEKPAFTD